MHPSRSILAAATASLALAAVLAGWTAGASAQGVLDPRAEAELAERVQARVTKELRESGALDRAVDAGIERYVERQRALAQQREQGPVAIRPVSATRDHIRGDPAAPVTVVEYSDFECPFCKSFHPTLKQLVAQSQGKVKWVYRHLPLEALHPVKARQEAVAAECAAELGGHEAFWKFADRFFELTPSHNRTALETVLPQIAREIGLDQARWTACLADGRHDSHVAQDVREATAGGARGTPWTLVVSPGGKVYPLSGAQPYAAVRQLVDLALDEK